jgi:hypothetical protein
MTYISHPAHSGLKATGVLLLGVVLMSILAGCARHETATKQPELTMDELNSAVTTWWMVKGKLPQNVNELTNLPSLQTRRLPTPPPGKKLAIDQATHQVVFIDE